MCVCLELVRLYIYIYAPTGHMYICIYAHIAHKTREVVTQREIRALKERQGQRQKERERVRRERKRHSAAINVITRSNTSSKPETLKP